MSKIGSRKGGLEYAPPNWGRVRKKVGDLNISSFELWGGSQQTKNDKHYYLICSKK